jgi:hypothetical protein
VILVPLSVVKCVFSGRFGAIALPCNVDVVENEEVLKPIDVDVGLSVFNR